MPDIFSKEKRSEVMSKIRSKDTIPEKIVRRYLFSKGLRFRLHNKGLPGNPDILLKKYGTAIFINGCFWHGHKCKIGSGLRKPKSNEKYWSAKLEKNIARDKTSYKLLKKSGWRVIIIWECQTRNVSLLAQLIDHQLEKKT